MDFFRSLKKRKINPASPPQHQHQSNTGDNAPTSSSTGEEPTGGFFYNLFFGNPSNNNSSKQSSNNKKRNAFADEEQYAANESEEEEDKENQANASSSRTLHRPTQPKKRIHSKYPEIKKHRDEIQKMKNSIQSLTDKNMEGASAAHVNMSMLTNTAITPKKNSDESVDEQTKGYPKTPNTPSSARKKKSLISSLFSFNSAANADSPPPPALPSTPNVVSSNFSTFTTNNNNNGINVKITDLKQDDLQRIKQSYRSPLYTRTPPKRNLQNFTTNNQLPQNFTTTTVGGASAVSEMKEKRKSVGYGNQLNSELAVAGCRNSFDSSNSQDSNQSAAIQTRKSQGGNCFNSNALTRESSSSSGFSNFSDSSNSFNTMSSVSQTPSTAAAQTFQYLTQPTNPFVFNLNLLKGKGIKNSGNGFKENSNVYAVIEIGNYRKTSKIIMNSSNPIWNQQFQFIIPSFYQPFQSEVSSNSSEAIPPINNLLTIRLYDHDEIFEHEFLGKIEFKLNDLFVQCCNDPGKVNEKTRELIMKRSKTYKQVMNLLGGVESSGTLEIQFRVEYHPRKDQQKQYQQSSGGVGGGGNVNNGVAYCFF